MLRKYVVAPLVWLIYKIISMTWRVTLIEPPELMEAVRNRKPIIFAHWHGHGPILPILCRRYRVATIISHSKDGDIMNMVMRLQGAKTSRGSSSRGGTGALKGLIKLVRSGRTCSFSVDGPKGPLYKCKPGIFEMSRLTGAPIFTAGLAADRAWNFEKAWDKAFFPKPFARLIINWTGPYPATTKFDDPHSPELAARIEEALRNSNAVAIKKIAALKIPG